MNDGFAATCQHCAGALSLALFAAPSPCTHCDAPDPLDAPTREAIARAEEKIRRSVATAQRRAERRDARSWDFGAMMAAVAGGSWLFFTLCALGAAINDIPPTTAVKAFIKLKLSATGDTAAMATVVAWWTLFALALLGLLSLCAALFTLFLLRKPEPAQPALGPSAPGASPRCHQCGATLERSDSLTACPRCAAVNAVDRKPIAPVERTLEAQLAAIEAQPTPSLKPSTRVAYGVVAVSAAAPALVMLAQLFKFDGAHATRPALLSGLWSLLALAASLALLWLSRWSAPAPTLAAARLGAKVLVKGQRYRVATRVRALTEATMGARTLTVLQPEDDELRPTLAIELDVQPRSVVLHAFEVHEGGGEFDPAESREAPIAYERRVRGESAPIFAITAPALRWFDVDPAAGAEPRWTMERFELAPDELVLLPG